MSDTDFAERLREIFALESIEQLAEIETLMMLLEKNQREGTYSQSVIEDLFRQFHSLKAGCASVGCQNIVNYLHSVESLLVLIKNKTMPLDEDLLKNLFGITDLLQTDIPNAIQTQADVAPREHETVVLYLKDKLIKSVENQTKKEETPKVEDVKVFYYQIVIRPFNGLLKNGYDPLIFLRDIWDSGEIININCNASSVPVLDHFDFDELYLSWEIILKTEKTQREIQDIFLFVSQGSEIIVEDVSNRYDIAGADKLLADKKIGEILVERGKVDEDALNKAIQQKPRTGDILIQEKQVQRGDLDKALSDQDHARKNLPTTIRVDIAKLDALVNLVGELVIAESRIKTLATSISDKDLQRPVLARCEELRRLISDLQQRAMSTRMVPVDTMFSQFHRMIRDLSQSQGKNIRLVLTGQETELDKNIIEKLNNPLKHIVRNSVDHGIERPEDREKLGKSREAIVHLKSYQKEGSVFVEISDDGKGLDKEAIYNKALEKQLISADESFTDDEIYNMIFLPGLSTAKQVTDISGRGVGMDVVKKAVEELKGKIEIKTEIHKGTTFTIQLPLTLAIIEGLLFRVGKDIFIIPLLAVDETIRPTKDKVKTLEGRGEYIDVRGSAYSLIRLHKIFDIKDARENVQDAMILSVNVNARPYAILVDDIIGQQEVVVKSLEQNFNKIDGLSGATILGDGSVATIIDPSEVVNIFKKYKNTVHTI